MRFVLSVILTIIAMKLHVEYAKPPARPELNCPGACLPLSEEYPVALKASWRWSFVHREWRIYFSGKVHNCQGYLGCECGSSIINLHWPKGNSPLTRAIDAAVCYSRCELTRSGVG